MKKVQISKISPDQSIQQLLAQLDSDKDGKLQTKEVDVDGDRFIDCGAPAKKWLYTSLGPVEQALFKQGLISDLRNCICLPTADKKDAVEVMQRHYAITRPGKGRATHLQTYGAGPCYVITLYHKSSKTGVMAHIDANTDVVRSLQDIANHLQKFGVDISKMEARLVGGNDSSRKQLDDIKKALSDIRISLVEEDTIGTTWASVMLDTRNGLLVDYSEEIHTTPPSEVSMLPFIIEIPGKLIPSHHPSLLKKQ